MKIFHDSVQPISGAKAPTEFRIWKYGENMTDHGPVIFNETSAKLIAESITKRGNLYSIDYDHLSLQQDRPATAGQASGWHEPEIRQDAEGKPEFWSTKTAWCQEAKEGLESNPPKWRYFSPAYQTDEDGVITDYINLALCINPATWNAPMLATRTSDNKENYLMDKESILAMLQALSQMEGLPEAVKAKLVEIMAAMEPTPESKPEMATEPVAEPVKEEPKVDAVSMDTAKRLAQAESKIQSMELEKLYQDNIGKKITPGLKGWFMSLDMDTASKFLKSAPLLDTSVKSIKRADTVGSVEQEKPQNPEADHIDKILGIRKASNLIGMATQVSRDGKYEIRTATPSEIRARRNK